MRRVATAIAILVSLSSGDARADGADSVLAHGTVFMARLNDYELSTGIGEDEPKPFEDKHLRLDGTGAFVGAGLRGTIQDGDGLRGGLGFGFFGAPGLDLRHDPLAPGLSTKADGAWGFRLEGFVGKGFRAPPVYPYIDVCAVLGLISADVQLQSEAFGLLSSTTYDVFTFTMGPRVGLFIPLDHTIFFDVSGSWGVFGPERVGAFVGVGIWDGTIDRDPDHTSVPVPEDAE